MSDEGTFANKENPEHHEQNITNIYNMFFQNDKDFKENFIDTDKPNQKNEQLINNTGTDLESVPRKSLLQRYFSSMARTVPTSPSALACQRTSAWSVN